MPFSTTDAGPPIGVPANKRHTFLFLQGHPSRFAFELANALEAKGCRILRVNFCLGDAIYWLGRRAISYRGRFRNWRGYLEDLIHREGVTDIIYYADRRPYHRVASKVAKDLGINAYVYEFGYLRPDWLTLERHGMTQWSHFPNQPEVIRAIAKAMPPPDLKSRYPGSVAIELAHEVFYNLVSYFFHFTYPFYNADRYYNPLVEYITGIPQQLTAARHEHEAKGVISELKRARRSYFLFPLQLQNDYQLRENAPFRHQSEAIHQVIESFARSARPDDVLVFKCHPMDNGGEHWGRHIADAASKHGVTARTRYIEGGALEDLINHASGIVLINSTTGVRALLAGKPVKVLGIALYDVPGLTHQGKLDEYWTAAGAPDADLVDAFARAMAGTIQVKGNFFSRKGRRAAIPVFVERLLSGSVNGHGAFVDPPPRLQCFKDA